MSLELDQPGKESVPHYNQHYDGKETINGPAYRTLSNEPAPFASRAQHTSRRSSTIPALLIALAIMTILAIVAAAVGGSTAKQRQNEHTPFNTHALTPHLLHGPQH